MGKTSSRRSASSVDLSAARSPGRKGGLAVVVAGKSGSACMPSDTRAKVAADI
ncbi:hypothetical protein LP419_40335 [Massilia sp. H-1]|nr:hypothetical protein LP419_40335 [Massilia sp. H-1]